MSAFSAVIGFGLAGLDVTLGFSFGGGFAAVMFGMAVLCFGVGLLELSEVRA